MAKGGGREKNGVAVISPVYNDRVAEGGRGHMTEEPSDHSTDRELFNFLRQMHLTGGANGMTVMSRESGREPYLIQGGGHHPTVVMSRKRKAWEGLSHSVGNKLFGGHKPPGTRGSDEDEHDEARQGLETPHCSRTGFDDEVGGGSDEGQEEEGGRWSKGDVLEPDGRWARPDDPDDDGRGRHGHESGGRGSTGSGHILSPMNPNLLNVDIDTDNLAADFDGSFTGLGVDINTANYSMSDAMLSLNTITLASSQLKQELSGNVHNGPRIITLKSEPPYILSNYGALDLSNDEAQHPDHQSHTPPPAHSHPPTFSGSVSRDNSLDGINAINNLNKRNNTHSETGSPDPLVSKQHPPHSSSNEFLVPSSQIPKSQRITLSHNEQGAHKSEIPEMRAKTEHGIGMLSSSDDEGDNKFQYILAASTSISSKVGEASLTYINQGQPYELKLKKLGDLSSHYRKKWLRSTVRICFHERRLQYIEASQIAEWSKAHPNERILEMDQALSYGIADVTQDPNNLNMISFYWDPTRDTGVFIKVHCISTEFTPKKHGGERGVPFRLQVETWTSDDVRIHAAACVLQVFKLKGADRKHKQNREKMSKLPTIEQEKFSRQYECTMLTDLTVDSIYISPSRGISPEQTVQPVSPAEPSSLIPPPPSSAPPPLSSSLLSLGSSRDVSPIKATPVIRDTATASLPSVPPGDSKSWKIMLPTTATAETTSGWLAYNRYNQHVKTFTCYDARDLLRLSKEDLISMIGLIDGIRLFNDLHTKPVAPRLTVYLAQKGESLFHAAMLQEVSVQELINNIASILQVQVGPGLIGKVLILGPNRIQVLLTDELLRQQPFESVFYYQLLNEEGCDGCTVLLEALPGVDG